MLPGPGEGSLDKGADEPPPIGPDSANHLNTADFSASGK
jgi:hypothetical protein